MILDIFNKYKVLVSTQLNYPKFFSLKFSFYRYALVFGLTNLVKHNKQDYFMTFGDYEEQPIEKLYKKIETTIDDHELGLVAVFQSSKKKYHFIAPKLLETFAESIHISNELGSHKEYLNYSALKNRFALRLTKKGHKDEPKLVCIIFGTKTKDIKIASDFVNLMRLNYNVNPSTFDGFEIVPAELQFTKYNTYNL
jgi:hypothetical protein